LLTFASLQVVNSYQLKCANPRSRLFVMSVIKHALNIWFIRLYTKTDPTKHYTAHKMVFGSTGETLLNKTMIKDILEHKIFFKRRCLFSVRVFGRVALGLYRRCSLLSTTFSSRNLSVVDDHQKTLSVGEVVDYKTCCRQHGQLSSFPFSQGNVVVDN